MFAMHYPTGVTTDPYPSTGILWDRLEQAGQDLGDWVVLQLSCTYQITGYVGPENHRRWREAHGVVLPEPRTLNVYEDDDAPVGVSRV